MPLLLNFKTAVWGSFIGLSIVAVPIGVSGQAMIAEEFPEKSNTIQVEPSQKLTQTKDIELPADYAKVPTPLSSREGCLLSDSDVKCSLKQGQKFPVNKVKLKLKERGYYNGEVDELLGPDTKRAVINFRRDHNLSSVFEVDDYLLALLGI